MRTKKTIEDGVVFKQGNPCTAAVVDYQPGNATSYKMAIMRVFPGEGAKKLAIPGGGWVFAFLDLPFMSAVIPDNKGAYLAAGYLQSKIGCGASDALVLAEFIAWYCDQTAQCALDSGAGS